MNIPEFRTTPFIRCKVKVGRGQCKGEACDSRGLCQSHEDFCSSGIPRRRCPDCIDAGW